MMTMKEACEYLVKSRTEKSAIHRAEVTKGDYCGKFTDKEFKMIKVKQKSSYAKGKSAAFNSVWRHHDLPKIS